MDVVGSQTTTIMKSLQLTGNQRNRVRRVVAETYDKIMNGLTYDGKIKYGGGRPVEIKPGSEEETMLADGKESGMSLDDVTVFINELRVGAMPGPLAFPLSSGQEKKWGVRPCGWLDEV